MADGSIWDKVVLGSESELSKRGQGKKELFGRRDQGWCFVGITEPGRQVTVGEEVESEHGGEVGEGPVSAGEEMEPFEDEQSEQSCPNLNA